MINQWSDYWRSYSYRDSFIKRLLSRINVWILIAILLIGVVGLTGYSVKTGNYVKVLEKNVTSLQEQLEICAEQTEITSTDLETCNANLQSKITALAVCQNQQSTLGDSLSECQNNLNTCEADYDTLQADYDDLQDNLNKCKSDLSTRTSEKNSLQNNYNAMKSNYINDYVKYYCCEHFKVENTTYTYYKFDNNDITCYNTTNVSGSTQFSC